MNNYKAITIYHHAVNATTRLKEWTSRQYDRVTSQTDIKVSVLQGGMEAANVVKLRIKTQEVIAIALTDKVVIGLEYSPTPPDDALTVIGFADNRKGSLNTWHWKVMCQ